MDSLRPQRSILQSSESNEWYTPKRYVEAARKVLGEIDLDPASNLYANRTVQAKMYYRKEDDGLSRNWHGRVFMNPPYGRQASAFVAKLLEQYEAGTVTAAVALLNANATETRWFAPLWDFTLCFADHRIHFDAHPSNPNKRRSTHGSVFVYLGRYADRFIRVFSGIGPVVQKAPIWPGYDETED